jgi:hypothetical protein
MEQRPEEANSCADGQEVHRFLWNLMTDYCVYKIPPLVINHTSGSQNLRATAFLVP